MEKHETKFFHLFECPNFLLQAQDTLAVIRIAFHNDLSVTSNLQRREE